MEEVQKNRIKSVNIIFLITMVISVTAAFLPLDFLLEKPALQIIFSQGLFALPAIIYMAVKRLPYAETVRFKRMKAADILWTVLFGILIQPAITLINAISMVFSENVTGVTMLGITENLPFLGGIFIMAVLPAVMEESVYRGVFYNEYSKVHPLKAAVLSGVMFGIMHGNINQFCYAAVLGFVFALLIEATGSILSTMLVHFWTNAASVVMLYLYPKLYEVAKTYHEMYMEYGNAETAAMLESIFGDMTQTSAEWMQQVMGSTAMLELTVGQILMLYGPQALLMGAFAAVVYRKLAKRSGNWERIRACFVRQRQEQSGEAEGRKQLVTVPLAVAIVIGIAFMIVYEVLLHKV